MTKHVIVPQEELDRLELARNELIDIILGNADTPEILFLKLSNVTGTMWGIANRKWPEAKGDEQ